MKKILYFAAMAVLMASCANEETVQVAAPGNAIGFDTFVGKVTKAGDVTTANLQSFFVYGGYDAATLVFEAQEVTSTSGGWAYTPLKYWEEGKDYYFAATAPAIANASYNLSALTATGYEAGDEDLIVATTGKITAKESGNTAVALNFKHALAKVKFTFTNTPTGATVSNVKVAGINSKADLEAAYGTGTLVTWKNAGTPKTYDATEAIYVLPQTVSADMVLSFTVSATESKSFTVDLNAAALTTWEMGQVYNYNVNLSEDLEIIGFDTTVDAWSDTDVNIVPEGEGDVDPSDPNDPSQDPDPDDELEFVEKESIETVLADTQIRKGNTTKQGSAISIELWNTYTDEKDLNTYTNLFLGLMRFGIPADLVNAEEYEISEAKIRIVTVQCKSDRNFEIYGYENDFIEADALYSTEETYVANALKEQPIATFSANGSGSNKAMQDNGLSDGEKYYDVAEWTNYIDVKDFLESKISDEKDSFNILIKRKASHDSNSGAFKFGTKEANDITNTFYSITFKKEDLVPQLILKYKVKEAKKN